MKKYFRLSLLCSVLLCSIVSADTLQSISSIEQVAYEYALNRAQAHFDTPQIEMGSLDSRLRLKQCEGSLNAFGKVANTGLGNQTVGVKCQSPVAWTVYVPVKIKVFKSVIVTTRPLTTNQVITATDIKLQNWDLSTLRQGYIESRNEVIGMALKHPIAMGVAVNSYNLKKQKLVRRGEQITLMASIGDMDVRMMGIALSDASLGQRVRVRNSSSKRIVEGVVNASGMVNVAH